MFVGYLLLNTRAAHFRAIIFREVQMHRLHARNYLTSFAARGVVLPATVGSVQHGRLQRRADRLRSAVAARILLFGQNQNYGPYSRHPEPRNIFVSFDFVTDDTPYYTWLFCICTCSRSGHLLPTLVCEALSFVVMNNSSTSCYGDKAHKRIKLSCTYIISIRWIHM